VFFTALPSRAQFTGDNQTNIISRTAVNWPGPYFGGPSLAGSGVLVQVPSIPTFNYRLQASPTLQPPAWANSGSPQSGTGSLLTFTEPGGTSNGTKRFYRISVQ
jgi:hypothetical protein